MSKDDKKGLFGKIQNMFSNNSNDSSSSDSSNKNLFDNIETFLNKQEIKDLPDNTKASVGSNNDLGDLRKAFTEMGDEFLKDTIQVEETTKPTLDLNTLDMVRSIMDKPMSEIDNPKRTHLEIERIQNNMRQLFNLNVDMTRTDEFNVDLVDDALFDIEEGFERMFKVKMTDVDIPASPIHYLDDLGKLEIPFPHMRKRRKQWAGKPTYRTATENVNVKKLKGYSMRSMLRHYPNLTIFEHRVKQNKMARAISHVQLWKAVKITPFETLKTRFELDLYDAHVQLCNFLFEYYQENTSGRKDAWDTYLPSGLLDQFIEENYEPTLRGFSALQYKVIEFIKTSWNQYKEEARDLRQTRYDMDLSSDDVSKLRDADKSIFKTKFGEKDIKRKQPKRDPRKSTKKK